MYHIVNIDNSYGGSVSEQVEGVNYTVSEPDLRMLIKPIWNASKWIEGLSIEEKDNLKTNSYLLKLQTVVSELCDKAEAKAIGKTGSKEYVISQRKFYENKYDYAKGTFLDQDTEDRLAVETSKFNASYGLNLTVEDFKQLIIYRFDDSKFLFQKYMMMIETGRTAIQTLIENKHWEKVEQAFVLIETLENENQNEIMDNILNL